MNIGRIHICDFTDAVIETKTPGGKPVYFEFSAMFGPLFTNKKGVPLKRQPQPDSASWAAFETWQATSKWKRKEQAP